MNASNLLKDISVLALDFFKDFLNRIEAVLNVLFICIASLKEEDSNYVRQACVDCLKDLLEHVSLVLSSDGRTRDEVAHPKGIGGGKLRDLKGFLEPILPKVKVNVVVGALHALREVFEGSKGNYVLVLVQYCDAQIVRLDQFQYLWERVDSTVDIVFAYLDQVDDLLAVIWVSSSKDDLVEV